MAKQWRLRIAKAKRAKDQTHNPGQHEKPCDRGERPRRAAQFRAGADRDPDDIRSRQELAQADDIEELRIAEPARCSTAMRRAHTIPPLKPKTDAVKNALAMAQSGARTGCCNGRTADMI